MFVLFIVLHVCDRLYSIFSRSVLAKNVYISCPIYRPAMNSDYSHIISRVTKTVEGPTMNTTSMAIDLRYIGLGLEVLGMGIISFTFISSYSFGIKKGREILYLLEIHLFWLMSVVLWDWCETLM